MTTTTKSRIYFIMAVVMGSLTAVASRAAEEKPAEFANPAEAADYNLQGEYKGQVTLEGVEQAFGVQLVAGGEGQFNAVAYPGGLPGDGWDGGAKLEADGKREGQKITFSTGSTAELQEGELAIHNADGQLLGRLKKVHRKSRSLELPPPPGAVVLFDGSSAEAFQDGRMTEDSLLMQGATSHETFQDFRLHLEFRTPFMPAARGQGRGNSGAYMQGRYEVQILDSFGLEGRDNECGGIYEVKPPDINMAYPPLAWQTYDVEFTAARYDESGKKTADARMTVRQNGVLIHNDVGIPRATRGNTVPDGPQPGPLYLQDHGNPVRFRNIWIVKRDAEAK
jgi:hypothetical protein